MEDDFLLNEDEEDLDSGYINEDEVEDPEDEDDVGSDGEDETEEEEESSQKLDYGDRLTKEEVWLSSAYNDIVLAAKKDLEKTSVGGGRTFDSYIIDAVRSIIMAAPKNTSATTVEHYTMELFQTQGHNRIPSSVYTPDQPIRVGDLAEEFGGGDDAEFNEEYAKEARNHIARFVKYLSERDLSKDSIVSKRRKQRQLPALIIFLFSSGMYDLIINCPTMPPEYASQIENALKRIQRIKYDIVEELAQKYEAEGRPAVGDRVRKVGLEWFTREPAEILTRSEYADLNLTQDDVVIYRAFRSRFTNASKAITQDLVSDLIEVVLDKDAGIYEKLKDKTRTDAINDVKQVYKEWSKESAGDNELAEKIIWKDPNLVNKI